MFRKTNPATDFDLFGSPSSFLPVRVQKMYSDKKAWYNEFFRLVTSKINEDVFRPLFASSRMGAPNASIRILVAMSILKEGFGYSDEDLFEKADFDLLVRKALGLTSVNDAAPSLDTYYLFRRRLCAYQAEYGVDLMQHCFVQVTGEQVKLFNIKGKTVRMDSKLIGSNIAWYSRYQIIHDTLVKFLKEGGIVTLNPSLRRKAEEFLNEDAEKTVYRSTANEIQGKMERLGRLIYMILIRCKFKDGLLHRVFHEQYNVVGGCVVPKDSHDISPKSVQNPNDPDAEYRKKGDDKVKGYSTNITETTDEEEKPNLIVGVQVEGASAADCNYVQGAVESAERVTGNAVEKVICDGAYQSESNRAFAKEHDITLITSGLQGKTPTYEPVIKDGVVASFINHLTGEILEATITKGGRWRIRGEGKTPYRYFSQEQIEAYKRRQEITDIPLEEKNKRNNVEATIFQYCFHTRNNKTRYRRLIKQRLQAYSRCMWINLRRMVIFQMKEYQRTLCETFFAYLEQIFALEVAVMKNLTISFLYSQ